jgi:hypothetical protein
MTEEVLSGGFEEYGRNPGLRVPHRVSLRRKPWEYGKERVILVGDSEKGTGHSVVLRNQTEG